MPTRRRIAEIERLLTALEEQTLPSGEFEVVLVDDGSGPDLAEQIDDMAERSSLDIRVLHHARSRGPATARNAGWRLTSAALIAFTDDDCRPRPTWLSQGLKAFDQADIGVVQGRTLRPGDSDAYRYSPFTAVREVLEPSPWFEGCNIFYRREALEDAGGFDEGAGTYGEDTNLGWAVLERGWIRGWAEDAIVEHDLSERPWSWHLWFHWRESNIVTLAARHPAVRRSFWRPWAVKRENALFAAAVLGVLLSPRHRLAIALTGPYLAWLAPGRKVGAAGAALQVSAHAASLAGKLVASARERSFLL